jgi:hypothetical protein
MIIIMEREEIKEEPGESSLPCSTMTEGIGPTIANRLQ